MAEHDKLLHTFRVRITTSLHGNRRIEHAWFIVRTTTPEDAAILYVKEHVSRSIEMDVANGSTLLVEVQREGALDTLVYRVSGETVPTYFANLVKKREET